MPRTKEPVDVARCRLVHKWSAESVTLLPHVRVTQVRPLAHFVLGMPWAGRVGLPAGGASLPPPVADASIERRLARWLHNDHVTVAALWAGLLAWLLASRARQPMPLLLIPVWWWHKPGGSVARRGPICSPGRRSGRPSTG